MKPPVFIPRFVTALLLIGAAIAAQCQVNTWGFKAHMQTPRTQFGAATGPDGRIYAIGGYTDVVHGGPPPSTQTVEAYDPLTDKWTYVSPTLDLSSRTEAVTGPNGKIYATNGFHLDAYDTASDTWTALAPPPQSAGFGGFVAGNDGRLYLIRGFAGSSQSALAQAYDIGTNTWSTPNSPTPSDLPLDGAAATAFNGVIYWTGGEDFTFTAIPYTTLYNAAADVWTNGSYMNVARFGHAVAPGGDHRLYAIGGGSSSSILSSVEALDLASGIWSSAPDIQIARVHPSAVEGSDGKVYVLGGESGIAALDSVECFQPAMLSASGTGISTQEGIQFSGTVATITDANTAHLAIDFTTSINWGDGSAPTAGTVSGSAGNFAVSGTHTYTEPGTYTTAITINDNDGESQTVTGSATVSDAPISATATNFTAYANIAFSGKVGTFSDGNPGAPISDYSATINWGDGSSSTGNIAVDPSGGCDVSGSHTYAAVGSYTFSIKVTDVDGATSSSNGSANVTEPPPVVTGRPISAVEGTIFSGKVASFTDADSTLGVGSSTASIAWGDGVTSSGTIVSNGAGGFNVLGSHTYAEEGSYALGVTAVVSGQSGSSSNLASVADAPLTATGYNLICKGTTFSDTVATFTDADPNGVGGDYTAGIVWGDGKSSVGTVVAFGSGWKVVGTHSYLKRGKYVVTIHMKDVGGATATATTNINAGPVK
jgi:hypothetical protein